MAALGRFSVPASCAEFYSSPSLPREKENYVQGAMEFLAAFGFLWHLGLCGKGELLLLGMLAQVEQ